MSEVRAIAPKVVKFLLCDDVRREQSGKLLVVGLYPAELVVLHNPVVDAEKKTVGTIQSLCFVFIASEGLGPFTATVRIKSPSDRKVFERELGQVLLEEDKTATIAGLVQPFPIAAFGAHKAELVLNRTEYSFRFEVRKGETAISGGKARRPNGKRRATRKGQLD